jgi:hypothetical protein
MKNELFSIEICCKTQKTQKTTRGYRMVSEMELLALSAPDF